MAVGSAIRCYNTAASSSLKEEETCESGIVNCRTRWPIVPTLDSILFCMNILIFKVAGSHRAHLLLRHQQLQWREIHFLIKHRFVDKYIYFGTKQVVSGCSKPSIGERVFSTLRWLHSWLFHTVGLNLANLDKSCYCTGDLCNKSNGAASVKVSKKKSRTVLSQNEKKKLGPRRTPPGVGGGGPAAVESLSRQG